MVARAGGYYGAYFKGDHGVMHGDLLSPTIFNMVVDAVVRQWVTVMAEGADEQGERGQESRLHNSFFYTDNGMVAFSEARLLQGAFSTLVGLFGRVVLWNNFGNTVCMVC